MTFLFVVLSTFGSLSGLYVMQSVWKDHTVVRDEPWLRWIYRLAMIGISLTFLWSAGIVYEGEAPRPPIFLLAFFWDVVMVTRAISIGMRRSHWDAPGVRHWQR